MKTIKIKTLKKAIKDAELRGLKDVLVADNDGNVLRIKEITVSSVTGIQIRLK